MNRAEWKAEWSKLRAMWSAARKSRNEHAAKAIRELAIKAIDNRVRSCFSMRERAPITYIKLDEYGYEDMRFAMKHNMSLPANYRRFS